MYVIDRQDLIKKCRLLNPETLLISRAVTTDTQAGITGCKWKAYSVGYVCTSMNCNIAGS